MKQAMLDLEGGEGAQDVGGNSGGNSIRIEVLFNRLMTEIFESSDIEELI